VEKNPLMNPVQAQMQATTTATTFLMYPHYHVNRGQTASELSPF